MADIGDKVTYTEGNWEYEGVVVAVNSDEGKRMVSITALGKVITEDNN